MKVSGCLQKRFLNTERICRHISRAIALVRSHDLRLLNFESLRRPSIQARCPSVPSCARSSERHVSLTVDKSPLQHDVSLKLASIFCLTLVCIGGPAAANNVVGRQQAFTRVLSGSSTAEGRPNVSIADQVTAINKLTYKAQASADAGAYQDAVDIYSKIVKQFPGLALTERARIRRAVLLYETGQVEQAIIELDDEEVALRGNAEVHAALAALLYAERPLERQRAELQWELASEFDTRYSDVKWVATEKKWGPKLINALQHFLALD